jgi:integrase
VSAPALVALPGGRAPQASWEEMLRDAVRAEFQVEVYHPVAGDRVLYGPTCAVSGCPGRGVNRSLGLKARGANRSIGAHFRGYLCLSHVQMWRRDGAPPIDGWVRHCARALRTQQVRAPCAITGCPRSELHRGLCGAHHHQWDRAGRPSLAEFARGARPVRTVERRCVVAGCTFAGISRDGFCDGHAGAYRNVRCAHPGLTPEGYLQHLGDARVICAPRYDMRGLGPLLALEMQLALQCRRDARRGQLQPLTFGQVVRWVLEEGVGSVLERGEKHWVDSAARRFGRRKSQANPLAWLRFIRQCALGLRERDAGEELWQWDTWPTDRIDVDGRWAHQPARRIYFSEIDPLWLRELVKRWARWRLTGATKSPASIAVSTSSIRRFCRWAEAHQVALPGPAAITRGLLERYRADVFLLPCSQGRRNGLLTDLKVFLDDVRLHEWAAGLPANATYYRGEIPRKSRALPRFIDEHVMGQLENWANLARLPDLTTQTAILILIETGLRSVDCLRLRYDPVTVDEAGAPYLLFLNHKLSREAIIPISERLVAQIRRQQQDLAQRFTPAPSVLLPRVRANPDGELPFSWSTLNRRLGRWLADCEVRDVTGQPVRVTAHQFRHTVGTRMINNEVPIDTVKRMLDHATPEMTALYATIKDQTLRREWERYQERINIRGEIIHLDPDGPLSDAAWALENLARAKQTLPNGYCGLPLQQTCPHPNACLTCQNFLTTTEFLPHHREQLRRTDELIATAQADGRQRLVEMNTPVRMNLLRIIEGLETLEVESNDAA